MKKNIVFAGIGSALAVLLLVGAGCSSEELAAELSEDVEQLGTDVSEQMDSLVATSGVSEDSPLAEDEFQIPDDWVLIESEQTDYKAWSPADYPTRIQVLPLDFFPERGSGEVVPFAEFDSVSVLEHKDSIENESDSNAEYRTLPTGDTALRLIRVEEGGYIFNRYRWFTDEEMVELGFVYPRKDDTAEFKEYFSLSSSERADFIEDLRNGNASPELQELFDTVELIASTLHR